jgi:hypothetical protein
MNIQARFPFVVRKQSVELFDGHIEYYVDGDNRFLELRQVTNVEVQKIFWIFPVYATYDIRFVLSDGQTVRILNITKSGRDLLLDTLHGLGVSEEAVEQTEVFGSTLGAVIRSASVQHSDRSHNALTSNYGVVAVIVSVVGFGLIWFAFLL